MESPYKKKSIKKHKPRPFKKMMQILKLKSDQSKPMDLDEDKTESNNNKMDVD
jgi:hypothetical protein